MSNSISRRAGVLAAGMLMVSSVQAVNTGSDNQDAIVQLEQAKLMLKDAQEKAEEIIRDAQREAKLITSSSQDQAIDLSPLSLQNDKVSVEINAGTLEEIVAAILPSNWRVLIDSKDANLKERRFQFVSTRTREQSLSDLLKPIGLKHQYFFDLKDAQGNPSPLIIVSAQ